jgi:hypothetical protein
MLLACDSRKVVVYTLEEFQELTREFTDDSLYPMGTYFWDEFKELEAQYRFSQSESKLLGKWVNLTVETGPIYVYYNFFPNKLFVLRFCLENFEVANSEAKYFDKAIGTWELAGDTVRITIYAIIIEDTSVDDNRKNKEILFVEQPYSIDVININDIDPLGFTRRPINDAVLSRELLKKVKIKEKNKTNNLMMRNVYSVDVITNTGKPEKNYGYFRRVPEMARENLSGLDIVTNSDLIDKYIFEMWP